MTINYNSSNNEQYRSCGK